MPNSTSDNTAYDRIEEPWLKALLKNDRHAHERDRRHFEEAHISAEQHERAQHLALGEDVLGKTRIYLDMKYWIYCRDAKENRPQKPQHLEIFHVLSELVAANRLICPVTYPILAETLGNQNRATRRQTAGVIDVLSQRVAIQPFDVLVGTELAHVFYSHAKGKEAVYPLPRLVWTFAGWLMGQPRLVVPELDDRTVNWMRKCIFDTVATAEFSMIVDALGEGDTAARDEYSELYTTLNDGAERHRHEVTSFDAVFRNEVAGILDVMKPRISRFLLSDFATKTGQAAPSPNSPEAKEAASAAASLIYHAYCLKKWTTEFPALHIGAGIHAAVRNRRQPYKRGDLWDFRHAHPALAYCNAFFTEKKLGDLLRRPPLRYDKAYDCHVLWDESDILDYLRAIAK